MADNSTVVTLLIERIRGAVAGLLARGRVVAREAARPRPVLIGLAVDAFRSREELLADDPGKSHPFGCSAAAPTGENALLPRSGKARAWGRPQARTSAKREEHLRVGAGREPALGARPLRRAILKQVQDPLAEALLGNRYPEGTTIKVGLDGETFTFTA